MNIHWLSYLRKWVFSLLILWVASMLGFSQSSLGSSPHEFEWNSSEWSGALAQLKYRNSNKSKLVVPHGNKGSIIFYLESFELWAPKGKKDVRYQFFKGKSDHGDLLYGYEFEEDLFLAYFVEEQFFIVQPKKNTESQYVRSTSELTHNSDEFICYNSEESLEYRRSHEGLPCQDKSFTQMRLTMLIASTTEWGDYFSTNEEIKQSIIQQVLALNVLYTRELNLTFYLQYSEDLWYGSRSNLPPSNVSKLEDMITFFNHQQNSYDFDLGHVFHRLSTSEKRAEGVAYIGGACKSGVKGSGLTAVQNPNNVAFNIRVLAHEVAHALGAHHTYYATSSACKDLSPSEGHGFEPGLGNSLMGFQGECSLYGNNSITSKALYFHSHSLNEMIKHLNFYRSCGIRTQRSFPPKVEVPFDFYVPKHTAFDLKAKSDSLLLYNWEQYNTDDRPLSIDEADPIMAGFFRDKPMYQSLPPSHSGNVRSFPHKSVQITQNNLSGEVYADVAREINMRLTARSIDQVTCKEVQIGVVDIEPLQIEYPLGGVKLILNAENDAEFYDDIIQIKWNHQSIRNIYMPYYKVDLWLSVDGGQSFPYLLGEQVANIGSASIKLPNIESDQARIKVSARDTRGLHEIYAFNTSNFTIQRKSNSYGGVDFSGKNNKGSQIPNWSVPNIKNSVVNVSLQYSSDNVNFYTLNDSLPVEYKLYVDHLLLSPINGERTYYKLLFKDINGDTYYSNVISVEPQASKVKLYPNPGKGQYIMLQSLSPGFKINRIDIFNAQGHRIATYPLDNNVTEMSVLTQLSPGFYLISVSGEDGLSHIEKYIVQ